MAEDLKDLFAEFRADTVWEVRPPGADRVRRTVRRRRTATAAFAGVLLLALSGTVVLLGFPSRPTTPANRDSLTQAELDRLTGLADRAVTAGNPGPAVFSRRGPVTGNLSATEQIYLGRIDLQIACAGTGSVTLLVRGRPGSESGSTAPVEVARITARCSATPVPAGATFVLGQFLDITVELVDAGSACGRAGFAYRATSDTGKPAARSEANDPSGVLPQDLPPGSGWGGGGEVGNRRLYAGWEPLNGDFRLAVACAGTGTLRIRLRQARSAADPDGTVFATKTWTAPCQYPPRRQDLVVGVISNRQVDLSLTYESTSPAPGDAAYQFLPR
ncbi:hypothetical protein [Actinoplanes auranticolor]|uniref:Uncharacterized protein n=1 Tax=Actinoplanes auranticolor TaxID=47988 RepID=A0A919S623_9ACTN|nr:hypothetical protein [Actinoplanes auranticolor]GIM64828.1 hypothetical protein Aau02nite_12900 [Actinoplanes auranticolor]